MELLASQIGLAPAGQAIPPTEPMLLAAEVHLAGLCQQVDSIERHLGGQRPQHRPPQERRWIGLGAIRTYSALGRPTGSGTKGSTVASTQVQTPSTPGPRYAAFISDSRGIDRELSEAPHDALQALGRPWYRRRTMRVFRDVTSLGTDPDAWANVRQSLDDSKFLILLAPPPAATSYWVNKEVEHWLTTKPTANILIASPTEIWSGPRSRRLGLAGDVTVTGRVLIWRARFGSWTSRGGDEAASKGTPHASIRLEKHCPSNL